jgi:hypothetical protein
MPPHSTWWWLGFQRVRVTKVTNPGGWTLHPKSAAFGEEKTPSWHTVPSQTAKLRQPLSWSCFLHRLLYLVSRLSFSIPIPPCERNSFFPSYSSSAIQTPGQARPSIGPRHRVPLLTRKKKKPLHCRFRSTLQCQSSPACSWKIVTNLQGRRFDRS